MIARDYLGDYLADHLGDYLNVIKKIKFFQKKRPLGGGQAAFASEQWSGDKSKLPASVVALYLAGLVSVADRYLISIAFIIYISF